jgi:hypothetical protein
MKQTAAHGKCGYLIFQKRVAWDSSTFLQIDLTNIKHYLYFFSLTLKMHESTQLPCAASEARRLNFHARCETFFDSLDFFFHNFYTFCFSSALLTLPSLFSLFSQHGLTLLLHFC